MPLNPAPDLPPPFAPDPSRVGPQTPARWPAAQHWHRPVFILFLVWLAVGWVTLALGIDWASDNGWAVALFLVLACATTLVSLARRLPLQNVLAAAGVIAAVAGVIELVSVFTDIPFGPRVYTGKLGSRLFHELPWPMPLLWVVVVINGRGIARLILRPWRKTTFYGFWVIGLTCLLAVGFDLSLEPFATQSQRFWLWHAPKSVPAWGSAPWVNFLAWFVTALAALGFATPWLLNKFPVKQPTDYHPLALWMLLNLLFATGCAQHRIWPALVFNLAFNAAVVIYTLRGGRW
ncbi:MAG: carotenoid biosynthesis protein [Verrucomicrobia bacterium]|nr:carotenoid biosynthesis protein [Verrucomicrobiota bacterium]